VPDRKQNLPQLYRFCFLMTGEAHKAQDAFHATLHAATSSASNGQAPGDPLWFYRHARARCLEVSEHGLQPEEVDLPQDDLSPTAPEQLKKVDPNQVAIWVSAAPDPQRTALALFYLDEFDHHDICELAEIKLADLSRMLEQARRQFQSWLNATVPERHEPAL
jgi:DNA-directed RNA polymerase specialized sigma24 family protein